MSLAYSNDQRQAAIMILTAMAVMGLVDNFVQVIAETTGLWQFHVVRSAMAIVILLALCSWRGWRLRPHRWKTVIARSAVLSVALMLYFSAVVIMPISEAVAGLFTAPIWMTLISVFLFKKRIGGLRIGAAFLGFMGVLLVLRPDAGGITWLTVLPLFSGALYAVAQIATREWCGDETAPTLLMGFFVALFLWGAIGLLGLTIFPVETVPAGADGFVWRRWGDMSAIAWAWTFAQAVGSLLAVGFIIRAYQLAEASFVAVFEYALLLFAVFWGYVFFDQVVDGWGMIGIATIILSGAVIALAPAPKLPEASTPPA